VRLLIVEDEAAARLMRGAGYNIADEGRTR
jgi:hypothetical protein